MCYYFVGVLIEFKGHMLIVVVSWFVIALHQAVQSPAFSDNVFVISTYLLIDFVW
jgi:hypothetical protein